MRTTIDEPVGANGTTPPLRVLIADDEVGSRRLLEAALSRRGYEVVSCEDGDAAWRALQSAYAPRLAVLDWMMPGMDGVEICRRLRATETHGARYLILLTSRQRTDDIVEALDAGADDHVRKPFEPDELAARVRAGFRVLELQDGLSRRVDQLKAINEAMGVFVGNGSWQQASAVLLRAALRQTDSACGFAGVVVEGALRVLAHEGSTWDAVENRDVYEKALRTYEEVGHLELRDLGNLFGRAITSGEVVLSNAPESDPRSSLGLPAGHPRLSSLLVVPILHAKQVVGILGVANRPDGYTSADVERVCLLASTGSVLYDSYRHAQAEAVLEARARQTEKLQAIGRLAGGIAHDFNNMLTAITGHSELLLGSVHALDPLRKDVVQIRKAAERAASLTRQLLAFSRKQVLAPQVLDLRGVLEDISPMLRRLLGEDVQLETRMPETLGCVHADRGQIEQVLMNLVINARDAMPRGGRITVSIADGQLAEALLRKGVGASGETGPCVILSVIDEGCGMDAETLSHLFEPFFTTKALGRGTGLGLATIYGIVRQSKGQICVESQVGQGTRFDVYLPRIDADGAQETEAQELLAPTAARATERLLLVEDDEYVRDLVQSVLSHEGYRVTVAGGCQEALRLWQEVGSEVALVVTDVVMPEMSGDRLVERLKATNPELRVLYMSGYTETGIVKQGVLAPGTNFIQKPFTPKALGQRIRALLDSPCREAVGSLDDR
jgi:DNA-binding response OmpR family regulator/signal transduction histidine kinase